MEALNGIGGHWFDLLQTTGIIGGLLLTAYLMRKDERARQITNSIAINGQYRELWKELFDHPELARAVAENADVEKEPISVQEEIFVTMLILHLVTAYRATQFGEYVTLKGLQSDVAEFFALPIPKTVWEKAKALQDEDFVRFVKECREGK